MHNLFFSSLCPPGVRPILGGLSFFGGGARMRIIRITSPNHNWRMGFYGFRSEGRIKAIGLRVPFTKLDFRLWWG
jgi:hypothetical protein